MKHIHSKTKARCPFALDGPLHRFLLPHKAGAEVYLPLTGFNRLAAPILRTPDSFGDATRGGLGMMMSGEGPNALVCVEMVDKSPRSVLFKKAGLT
jgi:hypothetical protein